MRIFRGVFWWIITIATLFLLDDMVIGPIYWAIALIDPVLSTILAFAVSLAVQLWIVTELMKPQPQRLARWLLDRLVPKRQSSQVAEREALIARRATTVLGAIAATPLIGAVIPIMVLHERGAVSSRWLAPLPLLLACIYSIEFALIHGGFGLGALTRSVFQQL